MKPDPRIVQQQLARMGGLNFFPRDPVELNELAQAFMTADSDAMVVAITNDWIKANAERPTPADIYASITRYRQENGRDEVQRDILPDPACRICKGDGWIYAERGGYTGAEKCRCWQMRQVPDIGFETLLAEPRRAARDDHSDEMEAAADVAKRIKIQ